MTTTRTDATAQMLRARYGLDRNPWPRRMVVGTIVAAYLSAAVFTAVLMTRSNQIEGNALSWEAGPRSVVVTMEVRGSSDTPLVCVVKAQDVTSTDIGYREFRVDSAPVTKRIELPTLFRASTVSVLGCGPEGEPLRVPPPDFPPGVAIP